MHRRFTAVAVALTVSLLLSGCSGGDDEPESSDTLRPRLQSARRTLDDAASLSFKLSTPELPSGVTGLIEADGTGTHDPAFDGKVNVSTGGATVSADVISVDGTVYAKLGFAPAFVPLDPASVGAPDPASLMSTDEGVSSLLTSTTELEQADKSRDGRDVLTEIDGTLPGDVVRRLIPSADSGADFEASYRLTDDDVLRDATIKGPFYPGGDAVSYTMVVSASDKSVDITAP